MLDMDIDGLLGVEVGEAHRMLLWFTRLPPSTYVMMGRLGPS
jgi:hypothetical protein